MASRNDKHEWEFPHLRETHQIPGVTSDFWSVKFYPYTKPGDDPVFAVVGGDSVLLCRPPSSEHGNTKVEVTRFIKDEEFEVEVKGNKTKVDNYACTWAKDIATGAPLLCIAGSLATIKVIDVITGKLLKTLIGHGGCINDLTTSPINPSILASASDDSTVRIWSLDPAHEQQPCIAILEGEGHRENVLSLAFHANGRYLLSGGMDHIINLWVLPEFPDSKAGTGTPTRISYPHFSTSEVHADIVDCVAFYNDLILSKAANEHCIVLWSITGFSSLSPIPAASSAPTTHDAQRSTRSCFAPVPTSVSPTTLSNTPVPFNRLLQFSTPDSEIIFMRFSLFSPLPTATATHPVLAYCNTGSKVFFWDFDRLEAYYDFKSGQSSAATSSFDSNSTSDPPPNPTDTSRPAFLIPFQRRNRASNVAHTVTAISRLARENSPTDSTSSHQTGSDGGESSTHHHVNPVAKTGKIDWEKSYEIWAKKYEMGDPLAELEAHREEVVKSLMFTGRQMAWSNDGAWCVVVGSAGIIALFGRNGK